MVEPISNFETTEVNSKYFNNWIGHDVNVIEPKLLFDLQELFKHYSSIIVPSKTVKVNYPTYDTSACADTQNDEIWIPTSVLQEGDIDNCIGLVVHELQHLNLSLKSSENIQFCYQFLNKLMQTIYIGDDDEGYETMYEILNKGGRVKFTDVYGETSNSSTSQIQFYKKAIGDIAFFLNAVEDVRIDSLTQPNLKKYIDVGDNKYSEEFINRYLKDEFKEKTLMNVGYCFLMHHKGFVNDAYIEKTYPDLGLLLKSTPYEWIPDVFDRYCEIFKTHVEALFNANKDQLGNDVSGSFNDMMTEFDSTTISSEVQQNSDDKVTKAMGTIEFEDTEIDTDANLEGSEMASQYKELVEPKMIPLSGGLIDQIEVMGRVKIYDNNENLQGERVEWNTIIVDTI